MGGKPCVPMNISACVAMARQSQTLDVRVRWAKLADAASVAAEGALVVVGNRSVLNIQS